MIVILIGAAAGALVGWFLGMERGYRDADRETQYWYENSQQWMDRYFRLLDGDDDDDPSPKRPPKKKAEPAAAEPVKAIARAAGARAGR